MNPKNYKLSGFYVRSYLSGVRRLTGTQYVRLMEKVGLGRFSHAYPPATSDPVLTGEELLPLLLEVQKTLGNTLYLLFLRNVGRVFANSALSVIGPSDPLRQLGPTLSAKDLYTIMQAHVKISNTAIQGEVASVRLAEADEGVIVEYHNCITCSISRELPQPECISIIAYLKQFLYGLTQRHFQVTETRCALVEGGNDCYFLIK